MIANCHLRLKVVGMGMIMGTIIAMGIVTGMGTIMGMTTATITITAKKTEEDRLDSELMAPDMDWMAEEEERVIPISVLKVPLEEAEEEGKRRKMMDTDTDMLMDMDMDMDIKKCWE